MIILAHRKEDGRWQRISARDHTQVSANGAWDRLIEIDEYRVTEYYVPPSKWEIWNGD